MRRQASVSTSRVTRKRRRSASSFKGFRVVLSPSRDPVLDDPLYAEETLRVDGVQRYANGDRKPHNYDRFEMDPRLADVWFRRMSVAAAAVQWRAMLRAMLDGATSLDIQNAVRAADQVQNRLLGKPIERMTVQGRVKVEFGGNLNPDAFPQEAKEAAAEVIDIPGDTGTHVDGEG
jgi:hypothetical protein